MNILSKIGIGLALGFPLLMIIGWLGLQIRPTNLPMPNERPKDLGEITIPDDLPPVVRRYYQVSLGEDVSKIDSLVVCGRGRANFGIWMPLRYRLTHKPGYEFERYMEVTWFGIPVLKAVDRFVDGKGMTGPMGREATGPEVDQGANMILWAEAPLMPSLWLTDPRIRWEEIDWFAARLIFPFDRQGDELREDEPEEDELIVYFDAETGLISRIFAMRYRDEESGKIPWYVDFLEWQTKDGMTLPARISVTWDDQGKPWSYWDLDEYFWNVSVEDITVQDGVEPELGHLRPLALQTE